MPGNKQCVATKGWLGLRGGTWLWGFKDYIDRAFMAKYSTDLPDMNMAAMSSATGAMADKQRRQQLRDGVGVAAEAAALAAAAQMRCGGCGAKV